jgi:2-haloacid dehalogenase
MPARFDAVLFDFAGTLFSQRALQQPLRDLLAEIAGDAGIEADEPAIRAAYKEAISGSFLEVDGEFYLHRDLFGGAFRRFLKALGGPVDEATVEHAIVAQRAMTLREAQIRPGVHETLRSLRGAGIHVGVVSNMDDDYLEPLLDILVLRDELDAWVSSETARSCKPHPAIYEHARRAAGGTTPDRALFVGDSPGPDIAGPNRLGFVTALILEEGHTRRPPRTVEETPDHVITAISEVRTIVGIDQ